jgi:hypothetical protein
VKVKVGREMVAVGRRVGGAKEIVCVGFRVGVGVLGRNEQPLDSSTTTNPINSSLVISVLARLGK